MAQCLCSHNRLGNRTRELHNRGKSTTGFHSLSIAQLDPQSLPGRKLPSGKHTEGNFLPKSWQMAHAMCHAKILKFSFSSAHSLHHIHSHNPSLFYLLSTAHFFTSPPLWEQEHRSWHHYQCNVLFRITAPEWTGGEHRGKRDKLTLISTPDGPWMVSDQSTATASCQVDIKGLFTAIKGHIYWQTT